MVARALRKIEAILEGLSIEPELATDEKLRILARQIGAQAEMLEMGIADERGPL